MAMPRVLEPALKICFQLTKLFTLRGTEKAENRYTHRARLQHRAKYIYIEQKKKAHLAHLTTVAGEAVPAG